MTVDVGVTVVVGVIDGVGVGVGVTQGFVALTCALPLTSVIVKTFPLPSDFLI